MNFETEVKSLVKQAVMQEINDLGIRAVIRERISETGLTDKDIEGMIRSTVDSYVKSASHTDINAKVKAMFDEKISEAINKEIKKIIGDYNYSWHGADKVKKALDNQISAVISQGFNIKVEISQKV